MNEEARKAVIAGAVVQFPMIGLFCFRAHLYSPSTWSEWATGISPILTVVGLALMLFCMLRLYTTKRLLVSNVFALTRHPMYHGMVIADSAHFFRNDNYADFFCWVTWAGFVLLMLAAGWFQEKETLARFGDEARAYYLKTPRFVIENLWRRT